MKKLILFSFILTMVTACDAPQRTRLTQVPGYSNGNGLTNPNTNSGSNGGGSPWTPGTTTGSSNGGSNLPSGFANCTFSNTGYAPGMGYLGFCQSTLDETVIAMKASLTDTAVRTCLIPTFKDGNGSSAYIGQPQCTYTNQNAVTQGQLPKNRSGFSGYTLNGLMVMKETSLTKYFKCMDAYISYVSPACPQGARTNATCDQYARNYMTQLCNDFKATSAYMDIRLK